MDKNKFVLSLMVAVVGLLMLISPKAFIALAVILLGLASIVDGIFIMVATRNLILDPDYKLMMTIRGVMSIVVGAVAIILPLTIAAIALTIAAIAWTIMAYVLAAYLIVSAGIEIYGITKLHRNGIMIKQSVIETVISLILAIALFIIPAEKAGGILVGICGVILLIAGCLNAFFQWRNRPITVVPDAVVSNDSAEEEN